MAKWFLNVIMFFLHSTGVIQDDYCYFIIARVVAEFKIEEHT